MAYRLGVDVGGTFTDLLLFDDGSGRFWRHKTPSTPADSSRGVMTGVAAICALAGVAPAAITLFLHGTTVATNAVLEGRGARVGLITTRGYRQVLQIARSLVPGGLAAWIVWPKPEPLARLDDSFEVGGRIGADGAELEPLDEAGARSALHALQDRGVEAVTISLMNAYVNGAHETRIGELAQEIMPGIPRSMSHDVLPEMQEYERTLTTVANAAMRPVVGRYVRNLRQSLRGVGMQGSIALLRSDGGLMASESAEEHPVSLLMSGPAGGVAGAVWVARQAGLPNILTLDVGGTSTDVALIQDYEPRRTRITHVGDLSVRASSLDVKTVGAGGGSIAHVPALTRALRVGPESAGADPGPAAYGKGGLRATVTDANVVLGYLPESLLGGTFTLDRAAAVDVVQAVARDLGIDLYEAARGIIDIANENMFGALRMISVQQGYDPRDFALMGFGGAGPLHVNAVARLMGSWPAVSPVSPGVLCALGDATTPMRTEIARSLSRLRSKVSDAEVFGLLRDMEDQARATLAADGVDPDSMVSHFEIDVRYHGQAFEVPMTVAIEGFQEGGLDRLAAAFDSEHRRLFTFVMDAEQEFVNLRVVALGATAEIPAQPIEEGDGDARAARIRDHDMWIDGAMRPGAIYDRAKLRAGDRVSGPAIIVEMDSTTLVLPDCAAEVDRFGTIFIRPIAASV